MKTLKIQVKFILNSTRTQYNYLFITQRAKFSESFPRMLKHNQPALRIKVLARRIRQTSSLTVAQRTEQERMTIMYIFRNKYNSSSLTKHN